MNKRAFGLLLSVFALTSCAKTKLLYGENEYNFPDFYKNYYVDWDGIKDIEIAENKPGLYSNLRSNAGDKITIGTKEITEYSWGGLKELQFGYNNNLGKIEKKFNYGITSKLFDGRVRCEMLYQKSRVQVDKSGFAMFFPKALIEAKYLGFACRGGTDFPQGQEFSHTDLKINFVWSFYIHREDGKYNKVTYNLDDVEIPVDNGGNTNFVNFVPYFEPTFTQLNGAVAMSFEWSCNDERLGPKGLTDDYLDKEKHHLSVMLYEVFIGDSTWL